MKKLRKKKSLVGWTRPAWIYHFNFTNSGRPMQLYIPPIFRGNGIWKRLNTKNVKVKLTIEQIGD